VDTAMKLRVIVVGSSWLIWGIICGLWTVEPGNNMGETIVSAIFHLIWYVATLAGLFFGGWWFLDEGAGLLGKWLDDRNKPSGGGEVM